MKKKGKRRKKRKGEVKTSERLFRIAQNLIPGGVNSPVRAFGAVGGTPLFIKKGKGQVILDEDGNRYIDFVLSWGPLILGHAPPSVIRGIRKAIAKGTTYGAPTRGEVELARLITDMVPSMEMVRLVSSGTEACMSALRLARAFTNRERIIKFSGNYHGHADSLLVMAGSGSMTHGVPSSPGVVATLSERTLIAKYNDLSSVRNLFDKFKGEIACVIVEPVAGNMGVVLPKPDFLKGLYDITREEGSLLIFDEVITGFRTGPSGAQGFYRIEPDITCFGKIIGGGLPLGGFGGKREIMEMLSPSGPVYQAGTLSGNPVAVRAGIETLKVLRRGKAYEYLERLGMKLEEGVLDAIHHAPFPLLFNRFGSMFTLFFRIEKADNYEDVMGCDTHLYARFFHHALSKGIYLPPSQFEACFLSTAHTERDVERYIKVVEEFVRSV